MVGLTTTHHQHIQGQGRIYIWGAEALSMPMAFSGIRHVRAASLHDKHVPMGTVGMHLQVLTCAAMPALPALYLIP